MPWLGVALWAPAEWKVVAGPAGHSGVLRALRAPPRPTPAGAAPRTAQRPPDPRRVAWTLATWGPAGRAAVATQGSFARLSLTPQRGPPFSTLFLAGSAFIQVQAKAPPSVWYPPQLHHPPALQTPYSPARLLEQG